MWKTAFKKFEEDTLLKEDNLFKLFKSFFPQISLGRFSIYFVSDVALMLCVHNSHLCFFSFRSYLFGGQCSHFITLENGLRLRIIYSEHHTNYFEISVLNKLIIREIISSDNSGKITYLQHKEKHFHRIYLSAILPDFKGRM